jgi:hypothetical protein
MGAIGKPPYRRGSKKTTDFKVGILDGKPSIQVNWGGRIYGSPLSLIGSGNQLATQRFGNLHASGYASFGSGIRVGPDSTSKSALRIESDGALSIGKKGATPHFSVTSAGVATYTGNFTGATWNGVDIDTDQIAADAIEASQIADDAVVTAAIADNAVTNALIATDAVNADSIVANCITASEIVSGTITSTQIASATIVTGDIASGTITGGNIAGTTITASNIAGTTITAAQIAGNTITASQIASGTITATEIDTASITADILDVGTVVVGEVGASKSNVQITSGAIKLRNNETAKIELDTSGNITLFGKILTGLDNGSHNNNASVVIGTNQAGTQGLYNVLIGPYAGSTVDSDGVGNTCVGYNSGDSISTGTYNICVGGAAGDTISSGNHNLIIGFGADVSSVSAENQVAIGKGATGVADNTIVLGNTSNVKTILASGTLSLKEQADDAVDIADYSQIWVKNTGDGILMFTDDNGTQYTVDVTAV